MTTPPPYRTVLAASADRIPWLEARRKGIGSSDVPNILGVGGSSAQHVYYDKIGALPLETDAGEAAFWGARDEETTARVWAERNQTSGRRIGLIARKDADWQMCTLDRQVRECPLARDGETERCALEVKHRNAFVAGKFKRSVPDDVLAQTLWQIHVTGYSHIHAAVRIGGNDYRQYVIRRRDHEDLIADIVTAVTRFWEGNVLARRVPALNGDENPDRMEDLFEALYPARSGIAHLDDTRSIEANEHLIAYELARHREKRAKAEKDAARIALVELLGDNEAATLHGQHVAAYGWDSTTKDGDPLVRESIDMNRLAEEFPEAYEACLRTKNVRRFNIARERRLDDAAADRLLTEVVDVLA